MLQESHGASRLYDDGNKFLNLQRNAIEVYLINDHYMS